MDRAGGRPPRLEGRRKRAQVPSDGGVAGRPPAPRDLTTSKPALRHGPALGLLRELLETGFAQGTRQLLGVGLGAGVPGRPWGQQSPCRAARWGAGRPWRPRRPSTHGNRICGGSLMCLVNIGCPRAGLIRDGSVENWGYLIAFCQNRASERGWHVDCHRAPHGSARKSRRGSRWTVHARRVNTAYTVDSNV